MWCAGHGGNNLVFHPGDQMKICQSVDSPVGGLFRVTMKFLIEVRFGVMEWRGLVPTWICTNEFLIIRSTYKEEV